MNMESLLREEIQDELENLKKMDLGTDTYKVTVDGITKMVDRVVEMEKHYNEQEERRKKQEADEAFKAEELKNERRDKKVKNVIAIIGVVIPAGVTVWGTCKMLKFEEEGTVTTIIGRGFINKLLPKK